MNTEIKILAPVHHLTARTLQGRIEIRDIVEAARKSKLIKLPKASKPAEAPRGKMTKNHC